MKNFDHSDSVWFSPDEAAWERDVPMALVTLRLDTAVEEPALHFLEAAERRALEDWAASGTLLMALVSRNRRELNLVVACNDDQVRMQAGELPSVASELARVEVRRVSPLALAGARRLVTH